LRFEKDRVLTCFDYRSTMNQPKVNFHENDENTMRGLENVYTDRVRRRLSGEKKDLMSALKAEEAWQKQSNKFPDLERFRAVSLRYTKGARDKALELAANDHKDIYGKPKSSSWRRKFMYSTPAAA
jgi:hypothetical protein